ncbi:uncharacterized protein DNG_03657 [Cephalotrichum gorgonifer]|uniref:Uncharacterized protein n=1 Tax=Cephalotrichum gorgonifer TaxID=2041049 RepID=A0AAE8MUM2_9PEZI|nr:uncharacterized protein DNG_03657 [Cephalotrichum gorgonifer]
MANRLLKSRKPKAPKEQKDPKLPKTNPQLGSKVPKPTGISRQPPNPKVNKFTKSASAPEHRSEHAFLTHNTNDDDDEKQVAPRASVAEPVLLVPKHTKHT